MSTSTRWMAVLALGCAGVVACGSQSSAPSTSSSSTKASTTTAAPSAAASATVPATAPTSTPQCIGLSICPPPPPDAEGNPACYYADGWQGNSAGAGIEVWYFHEPQNIPKPDKITALVRKKDGTNESRDANIEANQQTHRFEFPTVDKASVHEVLLVSSYGRCFVIGPGS